MSRAHTEAVRICCPVCTRYVGLALDVGQGVCPECSLEITVRTRAGRDLTVLTIARVPA